MKLLLAVVRPASLAALVATLAVTPANGDRPTRRRAKIDQARRSRST